MTREELLDHLLALFRRQGFDGASLAQLSEATGLGKSSLYHHFPGGKLEMGAAVLAHLEAGIHVALGPALTGPPSERLDRVLAVVDGLYDSGRLPCLLERLCASVDRAAFQASLGRVFGDLQARFETLALQAGVSEANARERAEDAVVRIQGALVVGAGTADPAVFTRALARIRGELLARCG
jgi:AcrR family transcriptional regulator